MKNLLYLTIVFFFLWACENKNEEELFPVNQVEIDSISFNDDVLPIFETNCFVCHATNIAYGGVVVDNYNDVIKSKERIYGALNHNDGYAPMPYNQDKLNQAILDKINQWFDEGAQNN